MRIALLANPDNLHVRRWIEWLADRGHELTLLTDPFTRTRPEECTTRTPRWNLATKILAFRLTSKPFGNDRWKHLHYRPLVRAAHPDVVHGIEAFNYGLATALAGPYPKVLMPMGKDVHHDADAWSMSGRMIRRALRGVDLITGNDETMHEFLALRFGIDPARVRPFSWGVDLEVFKPGLDDDAWVMRRKLDIEDDAPVILSPRNFDPYWGSDLLAGAIPQVLRDHPEAVFVILRGGGGKAKTIASVRRRAQREGWLESIRFVEDFVEPAEMAVLFNLARAFVSVPRSDLLAQTILEGMACGCLPILADHAAYRKHIESGVNGVVLSGYGASALASAIDEALRNDAMVEAARASNPPLMALHENWRVNALKIEDVYAAAIEMHRTRR